MSLQDIKNNMHQLLVSTFESLHQEMIGMMEYEDTVPLLIREQSVRSNKQKKTKSDKKIQETIIKQEHPDYPDFKGL